MRRLTILLATVGALLLVPAAQAFAEGTLTVNVVGVEGGSGEVNSVGGIPVFGGFGEGEPPIECSGPPSSGTCETELEEAEPEFNTIGLHALAAPGSEFLGWEEEGGFFPESYCPYLSSEEYPNECIAIGQGGNVEVTAYFVCETEGGCEGGGEETPNVKLNIEEGSGTVVSNPAGLECSGAAPTSCEKELPEGSVTLTASPAPGYLFKSWKKCDTGGVNGRQCTIAATSSLKEIGAKFVKVWNLDAAKAGSGLGKIQTSPGGILCLYNCQAASADFKEGSVTVKAAAAKNNHFVQWLGDCSGASPECSLNMNEDHEVEAEFAPDTQYALSISKEGGGQASIKSSPSGLLCGYTCVSQSASFYSGATVSIAVTLNKGTTALEWTTSAGTCTGSALTCTVPMSSAKTLVAKLS